FLVGVFAGDSEKLSLAAALPTVAALEAEHGSLLRGVLARRRNGAGSPAPSLVAPRAGVAALVRALADAIRPRLLPSTRAVALERTEGRPRVRLDGGRELVGDHVVLAVPPRAAAVLVAEHDEGLSARLRACPAVGTVVVHVGVAPTDVAHPLDGFGFLVA